MTNKEFNNEFDILYNSIATNDAPGLDIYEKSVYLTKAQLELVKNFFEPKGNKYQTGFEQSSKRRDDLKELIRNNISSTQIISNDGIHNDSKFFEIPSDVYIILQERIEVSNPECNNNQIKVIPKTHDEFEIQIDSPFKKPNEKIAWRLDYYSQINNKKNVELITPYSISKYKLRYIKYPSPIILGNLNTLYPGENLSIDSLSTEIECELSKNIHRQILDRAVELALADYKPEMLQIKTQVNSRNE